MQEGRRRLCLHLTLIDPLSPHDPRITRARLRELKRPGLEEQDQASLSAGDPLVNARCQQVLDVDGDPRLLESLPRRGLLERLPFLEMPTGHLPNLGSQTLVQHRQQSTLVHRPCERGCPGAPSHASQRNWLTPVARQSPGREALAAFDGFHRLASDLAKPATAADGGAQRCCPGAGSTDRAAEANLPVVGFQGSPSVTSHEYVGTPSWTSVQSSGIDSSAADHE